MQAIELHTTIDENHQIHLQLPEDYPPQAAKVIVLLETISPVPSKKRQFGQFKGKIHMADDFDAPLPDEFWLGEAR
ncbi:hypothetical protein KEF85_09935 [Methylomonas paludis]|uniref:DUF2281 domain-containing protein n=1 Tax=Methylomonas paludis TaxID=1173101 RepID=A0A975R7W4_9GAMM|nr:DUF2281 domain-containing protein [Methylomonas paludis]QWF69695.1 hypothetical protein KEF85_09935 [Methylomonas paludis]